LRVSVTGNFGHIRPVEGGELGRIDGLKVFVGAVEGDDDAGDVGGRKVCEEPVSEAWWIAPVAPKSLGPQVNRAVGLKFVRRRA
jgi:hypothetical protein